MVQVFGPYPSSQRVFAFSPSQTNWIQREGNHLVEWVTYFKVMPITYFLVVVGILSSKSHVKPFIIPVMKGWKIQFLRLSCGKLVALVAKSCLTRLWLHGLIRLLWVLVAHQALLSVEFSRQECWSGLTFPSPGDLPNPGIEPTSSALADTFLKPHDKLTHMRKFYITRCSQKHPRIASLPKGTNQFHQKENFCFFLLGAQPWDLEV